MNQFKNIDSHFQVKKPFFFVVIFCRLLVFLEKLSFFTILLVMLKWYLTFLKAYDSNVSAKNQSTFPPGLIAKYQQCVVNISPSYVQNIGKGFYRGVVVDVLQSDVIVLLVDFCKIIKTKLTNLRQITAQFKEEPAFVRICDLYGIKIKNWTGSKK